MVRAVLLVCSSRGGRLTPLPLSYSPPLTVFLWFGKPIIQAVKEWRTGTQPDPHYEKMRVYKEVPMW